MKNSLITKYVVIIAACLMQPVMVASGDDGSSWKSWLGPNGSGVVTGYPMKTDWSDGLKTIWNTNIGKGYAAVSVGDGMAFAMGHESGKDTVYCFDASTGEKKWSYSYSCKPVANLHKGGPSATPTYDGGRLYTMSKEGHFHCLDVKSGNVLWKKNVPGEVGSRMATWGYCSSPLIEGDMVILEAGATVAYHKVTGKKIWQTKAYKPGYGSSVAFSNRGKRYVASFNASGLMVVDVNNGDVIDLYEWKTDYDINATTPVIIDEGNKIFISSGYNRGCAMLSFDGKSLKRLWENKNMRNHMNNTIYIDGYLYGFDNNSPNGFLNCLDAKSGRKMWSKRGLGVGSLIGVNGNLVVLSERGELLIAPASSEDFKPTAREPITGGRFWTHPVLANGLIYIRNDNGKLVCVDVKP